MPESTPMKPFYEEDGITILQGECREILTTLPDQSVNCCVTSPPYWGLRDYGVAGQLGLEPTPEEYVTNLVAVFSEVRRVLRDDGTLWLNLGDSYATGAGAVGDCPGGGDQGERWKGNRGTHTAKNSGKHGPSLAAMGPRTQPNRMPLPGLKPKDLVGVPWRVAFAVQADGWYLRSDIIWHKPNPMPESVTDRPTKSHEYLFLLSKSERYYYDAEAIKEPFQTDPKENYPARSRITGRGNQAAAAIRGNDRGKSGGFPPKQDAVGKRGYVGFNARWHSRESEVLNGGARNKRSVWTIPTDPYPEAHFATFPTALIEPCIKAGCPTGGTVLDPFGGSGTTMQVARALGCRGLMIELNQDYCRLAGKRLRQAVLPLAEKPAEFRQESSKETKDLFEENSVA